MTQARPYAKAAFSHAKQQDQVAAWLNYLQTAGELMNHDVVRKTLINPKIKADNVVEFFKQALDLTLTEQQVYFIRLLAEERLCYLLPDIATIFTHLYQQDSDLLAVDVISATALSQQQQNKIQLMLQQRFDKQVQLNSSVDQQLIGGTIIRSDEWVIDGSVKGKLQQLKTQLVG